MPRKSLWGVDIMWEGVGWVPMGTCWEEEDIARRYGWRGGEE